MDYSNIKESQVFQKITTQDLHGLKQVINEKDDINQLHQQNEFNKYKFSTPLLYAIEQRWIEGVQLLIQVGADVHLCLDWEPKPLGLAVEKGDLEIVKLLLQAGANPNKGGVDDFPLHDAVALGRADIVKILIEAGVEMNGRNHSGETPLMVAAYNGNLPLVQILVEAGACVNLVDDEYGETALVMADEKGHQEIFEYLLSLI